MWSQTCRAQYTIVSCHTSVHNWLCNSNEIDWTITSLHVLVEPLSEYELFLGSCWYKIGTHILYTRVAAASTKLYLRMLHVTVTPLTFILSISSIIFSEFSLSCATTSSCVHTQSSWYSLLQQQRPGITPGVPPVRGCSFNYEQKLKNGKNCMEHLNDHVWCKYNDVNVSSVSKDTHRDI